jgi:glyoxylase-like metal-dependent hydrolase (beta-lactamase superfamily II)
MKFSIVPVTPYQQNCSIAVCEKTRRAAVVDPGGDLDRILDAAKQLDAVIEKILVTHGHLDHCAGTAPLARQLGVPVEGPQREDDFWIQQLPELSRRPGFAHAEVFQPDRWLEDGDTVSIGESQMEVLFCPGHTPGHVVFFSRPDKVALVGDVLFQGSIGRTDFPRGDHATLIASIRDKLWPLGDDVVFVPGHGPVSTFGQERRTNPFVRDPN